MIAFIEKIEPRPVDLMGHSRGGHIGFRVAEQRPDLLRKLVLAEPGGDLDASLLEPGALPPTPLAATMLMFHGNLVHGSSGNITPYPRKIVYLTLNAVSNYIRTPTRPDYIAHRDFTPIETVADDALVRLARAPRQAAE